MSKSLKVLYFASLRNETSQYEDNFSFPSEEVSAQAIKEAVQAKFPAIAQLVECCMIAVDGEYIFDLESPLELTEKSEVAMIPPISGGM
jgi:molybdopterin converting factor subunit 1